MQKAALLHVDGDHLARSQLAALDDRPGIDRDHPRLRSGYDEAVAGAQVPQGPQAVAVEGRAYPPPVGKGDGGRAVPRFHEGGVVPVEGPHGGILPAHALPRFRHEHHHGMPHVAPGQGEQF